MYCIRHFYEKDSESSLASVDKIPAREAYRRGYRAVCEKVQKAQEKYNRLMTYFCHYGNENYRDTVEKAIPGFFLYYDVDFAPTDSIITMDYPVFGIDMETEGIDRLDQYLDAILEEQDFLQQFPKDDVVNMLRSFHPRYEKEFFNLKEIFLMERKAVWK